MDLKDRISSAGMQCRRQSARETDLGPRMSLDLWKLELLVVGVHLADLVSGRRAEHLDDLDQLINAAVTGEYRLT